MVWRVAGRTEIEGHELLAAGSHGKAQEEGDERVGDADVDVVGRASVYVAAR